MSGGKCSLCGHHDAIPVWMHEHMVELLQLDPSIKNICAKCAHKLLEKERDDSKDH